MKIFSPYKIKNLELKNRVVMAPMCMYTSDNHGFPGSFHFSHYTTRAYGGVALIIQEATAIDPRGRITACDLGIWSEEHIPRLKQLVSAVHEAGSKIAIQLAHSGRKCKSGADHVISATDEAYSLDYQKPHLMKQGDIDSVVEAFRQGARRAKLAGYDAIEVHAAHGYLVNQFISPLINKTIPNYSESLKNRARFLREIITSVRLEWDGPLWVRVSADEYAPGGHHVEETIEVLNEIKDKIDAVDVSSGGVVSFPIKASPGYQIPLATRIKEAGFVVIAGGLITTHEQIETILEGNQADLVFLGRQLILDPYFLLRIAKTVDPSHMLKAYERG